MAFMIECPNCGFRSHTEFTWGGELLEEIPAGVEEEAALEADFARVWLRRNPAGVQRERWYHDGGCGRWVTKERDTRTNEFRETD